MSVSGVFSGTLRTTPGKYQGNSGNSNGFYNWSLKASLHNKIFNGSKVTPLSLSVRYYVRY